MSDKYKNKYRIPSARLQTWDYASEAAYFVTICTKDMVCFFGKVTGEEMQLSPIGEIVEKEWLKAFEMRPDMNLLMGEYITMPNHWHGIITIGENEYNSERRKKDRNKFVDNNGHASKDANKSDMNSEADGDAKHCVSTDKTNQDKVPTKKNHNPNAPKNKFGPQSKNLSSVIRGFKIGVTTNARKILPKFDWQFRFHEHIIRSQKSFDNISNYIINNPGSWRDDKFYRE